jgi:hypothetical protein
VPRSSTLGLILFALGGCAGTQTPARLRWVSSQATQASWSFVVDDRARGAELLVDGRLRDHDCDRQGKQIRCELRGLFPGGHAVEVRLPGAVLKRTAVVGREWPSWPALVRARSVEDAKEAAQAGADGVVVEEALGVETLQDIAEAAHAQGVRVFVQGGASAIELAAADGVVDATVPPELKARFPEAMTLVIDTAATEALAALAHPANANANAKRVANAGGLVAAHGIVEAALAYLAQNGALVDRAAFPLLQPRKRHAALRGAQVETSVDGDHWTLLLHTRTDELTLLVNLGREPWPARPENVPAPLDLLGSAVEGGVVTVRPADVALVVRTPAPDRTRY